MMSLMREGGPEPCELPGMGVQAMLSRLVYRYAVEKRPALDHDLICATGSLHEKIPIIWHPPRRSGAPRYRVVRDIVASVAKLMHRIVTCMS
jgi:hypothetical protein